VEKVAPTEPLARVLERVEKAAGFAAAEARVAAGASSLSVEGTFTAPEVQRGGAVLRDLQGSGSWRWEGGRSSWHAEASTSAGAGTLRLAARGSGPDAEVSVSARALDAGLVLAAAGFGSPAGPVRGAADVSLAASLKQGTWEVSRARVASPALSAAGIRWEQVLVEGEMGLSGGRVTAAAGTPAVRFAGRFSRAPGWPLSFTLEARELPAALVAAAAGRGGAAPGGRWRLEAEGSVRAEELLARGAQPASAIQDLHFSAAADNLALGGVSFGAVTASGRTEGGRLAGKVATVRPESALDWSLVLREPYPFSLEGSFSAAGPGGNGIRNGEPRLSARGRVRIAGALRAAERLGGTIRLEEFRAREYGLEIVAKDVAATLDGRGVEVANALVEAGGYPVRVSGRAGWSGVVDLRAAGKVPAAAVRAATDVFDRLDGTIVGEVRVTGPFRNPEVVGAGRLEKGAFSFRGYGQLFEEMSAEAVISRERIVFEHFEGRSGGGYLDGWGEVPLRFDKGHRFYFSVDFFDMRYPYPQEFRPMLQGHVELLGPLEDLVVVGDVEVQSARFSDPVRPEKLLLDFRRRVSGAGARRAEEGFRVRLDIDGVADGTIHVRNNLADIRAKGEFRIVGDSSRPVILGSFDALEGTVEYRGNRYDVKRLTLDFQDPRRNNPRIEARAETRKGNATITVSVTGTLEKYEVEFASDPPLSKNSIVSLLSLGVPAEALAGAEGAVGAGAAASIALGPYKGRVEEEIRGIVGLDRFAVEPSFSAASKSFEPRFTVGKDFGDRLSVSFSTSVGGATPDSAASAELKVGENVFVEGAWRSATTTREGDVGGDVKFRYRYKRFRDFLSRGAE